MWELDQMAADKLGTDPLAEKFRKFAAEKLTNVKDAPEQASMMTQYYEQQLAKNKEELMSTYKKAEAALQAKQKAADSMTDAYRDLLWKRKNTGWKGIASHGQIWAGSILTQVGRPKSTRHYRANLEAIVDDAAKYDRVHVYVNLRTLKASISSIRNLIPGIMQEMKRSDPWSCSWIKKR